MDTRTHPARTRVATVQAELRRLQLDGYFIPSADPHLSEYLPERWQGRQWLSGFTGSAGYVALTQDRCAVFADSRYWEQAEKELAGSGVELVKMAKNSADDPIAWLTAALKPGQTVGSDASILALALAAQLGGACKAAGLSWQPGVDALAGAWPERADLPKRPVREHRAPQATQSRAERLALVRAKLAERGATHHLVSSLDDIGWLLNLRGSDVDYNPVFVAHLLIAPEAATLFVSQGQIDATLAARLAQDGVHLADYAQAAAHLAALPPSAVVWLDPKRVTLGSRQALPAACRVVEAINPSTLAKSRKSALDAEHVREAMRQDGAAMCAFYAEFESRLARGERLSELDVDELLSRERAKRPGFFGLSFSTIAGWMANGALPHYRALPSSFSYLDGEGLLLIDSGGQYEGGTTDITRVWAIGTPTAQQCADYTRVLKGTLALSRTVFPRGTLSPMLDAIARAPLWEAGCDYGHGTGHGVGYFMNVHEGPQSISKAIPDATMAMEPGMITSIEPGLYRPGKWGVRIENLVLNVPLATPENGQFGDMLAFETLTLCPIDTRPIDRALLRADEVQWLDDYHATVRERLLPLVEGAARDWLLARTEAI
ncbi:MAG: aminopeptidase P family protein [Burkholderiales bacterium]|uniref:M24 family metallopeptidase n=1 Tax=Inhella sp. TaxID=1921806 RepID=UPI001AC53D6A|nr:aminopeptidase P family protein [Burkholderiales bacterium]